MTKIEDLQQNSTNVRLDVLNLVGMAGKGHIGGTFSCIEILVSLYMGGVLKFNPKKPDWANRDRFILSKGHACLALYSIFKKLGVISDDLYHSYGKDGGLGGQLDISIPGVDFNTGSLGHSIGVAAGMVLGSKMDNKKIFAYTLIGDSELYEGSCWEAMIFASEMKLTNLVVIVDRNKLMVTDYIGDAGPYLNIESKVENFGFEFLEVDGHNLKELLKVFAQVKKSKKPSLILANTIKGKGVSFFENNAKWHSLGIGEKELKQAKKELMKNE